jgi:hypothetical protein
MRSYVPLSAGRCDCLTASIRPRRLDASPLCDRDGS